MRRFYSRDTSKVFVLYRGQQLDEVVPKIEVKTRILPLQSLSKEVMGQITEMEGYLTFLYQRFVFGSAKTYVALAWAGEKLAHITWIIPWRRCRKRRVFVPEDGYMLASSLTKVCFRGKRIFPHVMQQIAKFSRKIGECWFVVNEKNIPSLKGIERTGAEYHGVLELRAWFWGILNSIKYYPRES